MKKIEEFYCKKTVEVMNGIFYKNKKYKAYKECGGNSYFIYYDNYEKAHLGEKGYRFFKNSQRLNNFKNHFETIVEYRKRKLNKLNNCF